MNNLPVVYSMSDLEKMGHAIVKSGLFGVKTTEQAITLMLVAQAEGLHPATAARDYHVIQGRPALKADAMLARFQQAGGKIEWEDYTDSKVSARFSHPSSPKPVLIEWTFEQAKKIGLANKDNWRNYPRAMLRARVISEGVRTCYPAIATGIYTPEEVMDMPKERDITPTSGAFAALSVKDQDVVAETAAQVKAFLANDQAADAYALWQDSKFDADKEVAFWSQLNSKERGTLERMKDAEQAQQKGTISPAKHKRLEALIKESKLDRQGLKDWIMGQFSKAHFTELTNDEYEKLDAHIAKIIASPRHDSLPQSVAPSPATEGAGDASYITIEQLKALEIFVEMKGIKGRFDTKLAASGIKSPDKIPANKFAAIKQWAEEAK